MNMSKTQKTIKKFEKQFTSKVSHGFGAFFHNVGNFFVRIFKVFDSKLTIMIVPSYMNPNLKNIDVINGMTGANPLNVDTPESYPAKNNALFRYP